MIEAYPAAADDFLPYVGKAGNMSALRQFCLIVAAISDSSSVTDRSEGMENTSCKTSIRHCINTFRSWIVACRI